MADDDMDTDLYRKVYVEYSMHHSEARVSVLLETVPDDDPQTQLAMSVRCEEYLILTTVY